jgi:hypothetical protein
VGLAALSRAGRWYVDRFVLTDKRVMLVQGLFTRRVATLPLVKVADLCYEQSLSGRVLGYGTFVVDEAGRSSGLRRVDDLPHPNELYLRLIEEMYEPQAVEARLRRCGPYDAPGGR